MLPGPRILALALSIAAGPVAAAPTIGGCPVFPADNYWNTRVDHLPVHPSSAAWIATIGASRGFHMDFGSGIYPDPPDPAAAPIGIPFNLVPGTQPRVPVVFTDAPDESDAAPGVPASNGTALYPYPPNAAIEGVGPPNATGDRHVLVIDTDNCVLYETGVSIPLAGGASWNAYSGAVFSLRSHALRPRTWTSSDAAGFPVFAGLARYDEALTGLIPHALRFTAPVTQRAFIWPARHQAGSTTSASAPPMGARFRLRGGYDLSRFSPIARAIAQTMKTYGIVLADNGSAWFVTGAPDPRWDNGVLHELDVLRGSDFEAVDTCSLMLDPDSGQADVTLDRDGDGIPNCVEGGVARNATAKDNDVFGDARLFAMQQYRDFLAREGDAGGIDFWRGQIASGAQSRLQVTSQFFASQEFQSAIAPVTRLYFAYFLRIPDYGGLTFWIQQYKAGVPLERISDAFAQSAEFTGRYGTLGNAAFVDLVYRNVLGRAPDAGGLAFWTGNLDTAAITRGGMMIGFSESAEYRALIDSEVFVTMMYAGMLRRAPDQAGFDFWVAQRDAGGGDALIAGFLQSPEYRARFLP